MLNFRVKEGLKMQIKYNEEYIVKIEVQQILVRKLEGWEVGD
jgi:hypothetical protein